MCRLAIGPFLAPKARSSALRHAGAFPDEVEFAPVYGWVIQNLPGRDVVEITLSCSDHQGRDAVAEAVAKPRAKPTNRSDLAT